MNIFVVEWGLIESAKSLFDTHVVKMPTEAMQLLSVAARFYFPEEVCAELPLHKVTHPHHSCQKWLQESPSNFNWLLLYTRAMCAEYTWRYGKIHAIYHLASRLPWLQGGYEMTPFALAMPEHFREEDPVRSYRNLYRYDKLPNLPRAAYTRRTPPDWLQHPEHGRWVASPTGDCYVYRSD